MTSSNNILSVNSWPNQIEQRFCLPFVFISKKIDFANLNDFILYYADASKFGILKWHAQKLLLQFSNTNFVLKGQSNKIFDHLLLYPLDWTHLVHWMTDKNIFDAKKLKKTFFNIFNLGLHYYNRNPHQILCPCTFIKSLCRCLGNECWLPALWSFTPRRLTTRANILSGRLTRHTPARFDQLTPRGGVKKFK